MFSSTYMYMLIIQQVIIIFYIIHDILHIIITHHKEKRNPLKERQVQCVCLKFIFQESKAQCLLGSDIGFVSSLSSLIISPIQFPLKILHLHISLNARKKNRVQPHLQYDRTDRRHRATFINFPHLTGAVGPLKPFKGHNKDGYKSKKGHSVWSQNISKFLLQILLKCTSLISTHKISLFLCNVCLLPYISTNIKRRSTFFYISHYWMIQK